MQSTSLIINIIFIAIMIIMFFCYLWGMIRYNKTRKEVDKLFDELKEIEEDGRTRKLESINYDKIKGEVNAFNETLMPKGEKHYSTIGVERYFNSVTLLEEKLNMRIINNIPQIFPGVGILGTFLGLALGLRAVNTSGSSNEILNSIQPLLANISLAFITSIVGIGFSILATFILHWFLGGAEEKILKLENIARRIFPLYTKTLQGEELLKEIKEIKTTTNGLATDISNQLGEHISTQVGEKIDTLVSGSNEIMKGLTHDIGDKVERITETLSNDFGDSLTGALDKIFTEDLVDNFKQIGIDIVTLSGENMTNLKNFKETMDSVILDLNDIKGNYEDINDKTSKTNKEVSSSLDHLTETIVERTELVDKSLEKTDSIFNNAASQVKVLEESLSNSLKDTFNTLEKLSEYMMTNREISKSMENIINSEEGMEKLNSFEEVIGKITSDLNDIRESYEEINIKTSVTNKEVINSLDKLTGTLVERTEIVDEQLEKTATTFNKATKQVEVLETSLNNGLKETTATIEKLSDYMNINKEVSESMNKFIGSEEKILELWNGYDDKFTDLNILLVEGSKGFEKSLNASVSSYKDQLNGIRDEFATMMTTLNQKYSDYTNKNTINLFKEYDHQLATAINKFGGLMSRLEEEVEGLQIMIETQNEKIGEAIEIITPIKTIEIEKNIQD